MAEVRRNPYGPMSDSFIKAAMMKRYKVLWPKVVAIMLLISPFNADNASRPIRPSSPLTIFGTLPSSTRRSAAAIAVRTITPSSSHR